MAESLPKGLDIIAEEIHPDEKAYFLVELPLSTRDFRSKHRYQIIYVNRGDTIAAHPIKISSDIDSPGFRIPSLWEHSVAELQDMADELRARNGMEKRLVELQQSSTLITDVIRLSEELKLRREHISQFGSGSITPATQRT